MGCQGEQVDGHRLHIPLHQIGCLDGIGMKQSAVLTGYLPDFRDRLDGAHLVIGGHNRHQNGIRPQRIGDSLRVDTPKLIDTEDSEFKSVNVAQVFGGMQNRLVFNDAGDQMVSPAGRSGGHHDPFDG